MKLPVDLIHCEQAEEQHVLLLIASNYDHHSYAHRNYVDHNLKLAIQIQLDVDTLLHFVHMIDLVATILLVILQLEYLIDVSNERETLN